MAKRILIADDSLTIQKAFAMTFAGEDVTLLAARSADEGLTMARQARPELVIADAVMPGRSGYDLCSAIKADPSLRGVPVYILSSAQNPYDEARARQSGADGQLTKPFESVVLVEAVKDALARSAVANSVSAATPAPLFRPAFGASAAGAGDGAGSGLMRSAATTGLDDDYGEISIEDSGPQPGPGQQVLATGASQAAVLPMAPSAPAAMSAEVTPPPTPPLVAPRPALPSSQPSSQSSSQFSLAAPVATPFGPGGLRPSLIPGLRPGAAPPPARPGSTMPARQPTPAAAAGTHPAGATPSPVALPPAAFSQARISTPSHVPALRAPYPQALPGPARTLVGLPATVPQSPVRFGAPSAPPRPPTQPVRPLDSRTPPPLGPPSFQPAAAAPLFPASAVSATAVVASKIDQKIAAIAARGPEYEAIAKLSREIIEKIVWEVVPELAEVIIREELQKRGRV